MHYLIIASRESEILFSHSFTSEISLCTPALLDACVNKCIEDSRGENGINVVEEDTSTLEQGGRLLVYRWFGACLAIVSTDSTDNLLQTYEFLSLYMTALQQYFPKLSRHTIVQNPAKLHLVLEEMVIGGVLVETSVTHALSYVRLLDDVAT